MIMMTSGLNIIIEVNQMFRRLFMMRWDAIYWMISA